MADKNSIYCPNCQQRTSVSTRAKHGPVGGVRYEIVECNACDYFLLAKREVHYNDILEVHPKSLPKAVDKRIPDKISDDFAEALLCRSVNANRGAAVLARRAVQTICKDKGATKRDLKDQIDELFTKNIITKDLQDWAHEVRYVGNDAAHPNDSEVTKEEAEDILELLESLCDVLYVAPARAAERKRVREGEDAR